MSEWMDLVGLMGGCFGRKWEIRIELGEDFWEGERGERVGQRRKRNAAVSGREGEAASRKSPGSGT